MRESTSMTLHDSLQASASRYPDRVALVDGVHRITYSVLVGKVEAATSFLVREGVAPGDRVAILLENSVEYVVAYFSVLRAGGIAVPLSDQVAGRGLAKALGDCRPTVVIVHRKLLGVLRECLLALPSVKMAIVAWRGALEQRDDDGSYAEKGFSLDGTRSFRMSEVVKADSDPATFPIVGASDLALILYTSGTTGDPKGVMLTHRNLLANADSIIDYLKLGSSDSVLVVLPFHYSYGNSLLTTHVRAGATLVLENAFLYPNVVLDRMVQEGVTGFAGVPSTFAILLHRSNFRRYSFPSLRYLTQAGGAMAPKHALELLRILPGTQIFIMYGQTEASARLTYLEPSELLRKAGSIGKAIPGVHIRLLKEGGTPADVGEMGEIVASGENIMAGYWNNPGETNRVLRGGGLHTGDLALADEEGFLYIVGRSKEMIKSGAHRISPKEIEEVILEMPSVHEAAVIGIEDEILGEAILAYVVPNHGGGTTEREILKHCRNNLPPYKIPKQVCLVAELPKTASGKVRKHALGSRTQPAAEPTR